MQTSSSLVPASIVERLSANAAIRTSNGAFIHSIYRSAGSITGQTNCGLKSGRSSRRSAVNLAEVHVDKLCAKCFNVPAIVEAAS